MNISEYINSNIMLRSLDYMTVFMVISELIKDGKLADEDVQPL